MANERETKRERRETARRARIEAQRRAAARKQRNRILALVAVVVAGGLIAFGVWFSGKSEREAVGRLDSGSAPAGCTKPQTYPSEGQEHVEQPQRVEYKTEPPTSGNHYGNVSLTGVHSTAVQAESFVHNLEHGHMVITYDPAKLDGAIVDALESFVRENETLAVITPRPELAAEGNQLAFATWQHSSTCANPTDPDSVAAYADLYFQALAGKGPEGRIPGTPNR